ncbi:MAG: hypothetical protein ACR2MA_09375 [Egibacteraceae bacterium]
MHALEHLVELLAAHRDGIIRRGIVVERDAEVDPDLAQSEVAGADARLGGRRSSDLAVPLGDGGLVDGRHEERGGVEQRAPGRDPGVLRVG